MMMMMMMATLLIYSSAVFSEMKHSKKAHHYHHHLGVQIPQIPLTLSCYPYQLVIDLGNVYTKLKKVSFCRSAHTGMSRWWSSLEDVASEFFFTFTSNVQYVLFVLLRWFVRWKVSDRTATILWSAPSRIYSKKPSASLCSSSLLVSSGVASNFRWCNHKVVLETHQK